MEKPLAFPKFHTRPITMSRTWAEAPNGRVLPDDCPEVFWPNRIEEIAAEKGVPVP